MTKTYHKESIIDVLDALTDKVGELGYDDMVAELIQLGDEVQGNYLTIEEIGERLSEIVEVTAGDDYNEGLKTGLRLMTQLYMNFIQETRGTRQEKAGRENFEKLTNAHFYVNGMAKPFEER